MRYLKRTLIAFVIGVGIATAIFAFAEKNYLSALDEYNEQLTDALLADGSPRATALAATTLTHADRDSRPAIDARRHELLDQATQMAPDDAWVQWMAAVSPLPTDTLSEPAQALQRLEPDNGAVWLFQLQVATRAKDDEGITNALERIGASDHFDNYYTTSVLEWLKFFREHPLPEPRLPFDQQVAATAPLFMAVSRAAAMSMANHVSPTSACKSKGKPLSAARRTACLAAGRLMLAESNSLDSLRIGAALLDLAGAENAADSTRNTEYFSEKYVLLSNEALKDPDTFARWQADYLQTRNEIQTARNFLNRAGIPLTPPTGWKSDLQRFRVNQDSPKRG